MSVLRGIDGPSMLFCPADRPERYGKALARADSVIIDLEDAVRSEAKEGARESLAAWCREQGPASALSADPARVIVRVNPAGTESCERDLDVLAGLPVRVVMLAKTESVDPLDRLEAALPDVSIIALCETPRGIAASAEVAFHHAVSALMWGAEDLIAAIGGSSSQGPGGGYRDVARLARANVLLNASVAGIPAIDSIYADFTDAGGLAYESRDACSTGFQFKACIHPSQVPVVREAFLPAADDLEYARELLEAARGTRGAVQFRGAMVDEPLVRHAENIVRRARHGCSPA